MNHFYYETLSFEGVHILEYQSEPEKVKEISKNIREVSEISPMIDLREIFMLYSAFFSALVP